MKYCTNCGTALADNSKFCQNCGAPVAIAPGAATSSSAGLVMAYKMVGEYKLDLLVNAKFLRIFIIPVVLHTLWDSGIFEGVWFLVVLTIVGWAICLLLVNMGLAQAEKISQENRQSLGQNC